MFLIGEFQCIFKKTPEVMLNKEKVNKKIDTCFSIRRSWFTIHEVETVLLLLFFVCIDRVQKHEDSHY